MARRLILLGLILLILAACSIPNTGAWYVPPKGVLIIPVIDLVKYIETAPVIEVDGLRVHDVSWLGDGVAWLEGTGWVENRLWRMALAGHNPGAFSRLGEVQMGDSIYLITEIGLLRYVAAEFYVVDPAETWVLGSSDGPSLALITCSGDRRLVVVAVRTEGGHGSG